MNNTEILFLTLAVAAIIAMSYKTYEKFCSPMNWKSGYIGYAVSDGCQGKDDCSYKKSPKTGCFGCNKTPVGRYTTKEMCHNKFNNFCGRWSNMYEPCTDPFNWGPTYSTGPFPHAYAFNRVPELEK